MTRIAFNLGRLNLWIGGRTYFENLFHAIRLARDSKEHTFIGVLDDPGTLASTKDYFDETLVLPPASRFTKFSARAARIFMRSRFTENLAPEAQVSRLLRSAHADVTFLKQSPGSNFALPTVCWFPDFQYLHMPEMFTQDDAEHFDSMIRGMGRYAARLMLSSQNARKDFEKILPQFAHKVAVIPFTAWIDEAVLGADPEAICSEYHLPRKFIYLPNQFWKHKNHELALRALTLAVKQLPEVTLVASGPIEDYRNPGYASDFVASVWRADMRDRFLVLGTVPRLHVYGLMRQSLAVLQPSLFEGWSSSIEEAKSLGKLVIASKLEVHLEQNAPGARYFDPHDPQQLADLLIKTYQEGRPGPDQEAEARARLAMTERAREFGARFLALCSEAAAS